jgi:hypothetical protein
MKQSSALFTQFFSAVRRSDRILIVLMA